MTYPFIDMNALASHSGFALHRFIQFHGRWRKGPRLDDLHAGRIVAQPTSSSKRAQATCGWSAPHRRPDSLRVASSVASPRIVAPHDPVRRDRCLFPLFMKFRSRSCYPCPRNQSLPQHKAPGRHWSVFAGHRCQWPGLHRRCHSARSRNKQIAGDDIQQPGQSRAHQPHGTARRCGLSLDNVVKTTCFLQDLGDFPIFNEVYAPTSTGTPPLPEARSRSPNCRWACWSKLNVSPSLQQASSRTQSRLARSGGRRDRVRIRLSPAAPPVYTLAAPG